MIKVRIDGQIVELPTLKGADGKSAYQYAVEAGYEGTEQEFINLLIEGTDVINNHLTDTSAHADIRNLISSLSIKTDAIDTENKTINTKVDEILNGGLEIKQSDYEQTDNTENDYIKNRPFYYDKNLIYNWDGDTTNRVHSIAISDFYKVAEYTDFEDGTQFLLKYQINKAEDQTEIEFSFPTNGFYYYISTTSTYVFFISPNNLSAGPAFPESGIYANTGISELYTVDFKQLDEKFVPDTIARTPSTSDALDILLSAEFIQEISANGQTYTDAVGDIRSAISDEIALAKSDNITSC